MSQITVRIENLAKRYRLGAMRTMAGALGQMLVSSARHGGRGICRRPEFWALRNVSFGVQRGDDARPERS